MSTNAVTKRTGSLPIAGGLKFRPMGRPVKARRSDRDGRWRTPTVPDYPAAMRRSLVVAVIGLAFTGACGRASPSNSTVVTFPGSMLGGEGVVLRQQLER